MPSLLKTVEVASDDVAGAPLKRHTGWSTAAVLDAGGVVSCQGLHFIAVGFGVVQWQRRCAAHQNARATRPVALLSSIVPRASLAPPSDSARHDPTLPDLVESLDLPWAPGEHLENRHIGGINRGDRGISLQKSPPRKTEDYRTRNSVLSGYNARWKTSYR